MKIIRILYIYILFFYIYIYIYIYIKRERERNRKRERETNRERERDLQATKHDWITKGRMLALIYKLAPYEGVLLHDAACSPACGMCVSWCPSCMLRPCIGKSVYGNNWHVAIWVFAFSVLQQTGKDLEIIQVSDQ